MAVLSNIDSILELHQSIEWNVHVHAKYMFDMAKHRIQMKNQHNYNEYEIKSH